MVLQIVRRFLSSCQRYISSHSNSNRVSMEVKKVLGNSSVAVISMNNAPVNALTLPFLQELSQALKTAEATEGVHAFVLKSSIPNQFSAGFDITELCGKPKNDVENFYRTVLDVWLQIYSSKLATVAYINGHCVAAMFLFLMSFDYCLGVNGHYTLGLPGVRFGMYSPTWALKLLEDIIGKKNAEYNIQTGQLFTPDKALNLGILNMLSTPERAGEDCMNVVKSYLSVSQERRQDLKLSMREDFIQKFEEVQKNDVQKFAKFVCKDEVQKALGVHLQNMK